jgi:hypothetical protein
MDTSYALLHNQLRTETDLAKLRSRNGCDIAQGRLQEMGMDDTIMIVLPDLKMSYVVYPRAHAYIEAPLTWREIGPAVFRKPTALLLLGAFAATWVREGR